MNENARLAGDLLKQEDIADQRFRTELNAKKNEWIKEKSEILNQLQQTKIVLECLRSNNNNNNKYVLCKYLANDL